MRAMDEPQRSGKGPARRTRGDRERPGARRAPAAAAWVRKTGTSARARSSSPGRGRSGTPKGEATQRLRANPCDVGVEGESRRATAATVLRHQPDRPRRQHGRRGSSTGVVIGQYREGDGGRDHAGAGPARLPIRSGATSRRSTSDKTEDRCRRRARRVFSVGVSGPARAPLAALAPRAFAVREGRAAEPAPGALSVGVPATIARTASATTSATSTGTSTRAASIGCTSSSSSTRRICASI